MSLTLLLAILFVLGYAAFILELQIKLHKTAVALLLAIASWTLFFALTPLSLSDAVEELSHHVANVAQILFFLMGAMTLVELIDCHKGFKLITDCIRTSSPAITLWVIGGITFFLSAILDNLTTAIVMVSLLRKLIAEKEERLLPLCIIIIAANAGGAWTPIGDVTTTMLWINGQLSSLGVMKALFVPSLVALMVPLGYFTWQLRRRKFPPFLPKEREELEPGGKVVFFAGVGALIFVPVFHALTGLPPFMGILLGLACLWLLTDCMHYKYTERHYLRVPHVLTRIDTSGVLFFLGILLSVDALDSAGVLRILADFLDNTLQNFSLIATSIGLFSAIVDNIPIVAATMGMYSLEQFPLDHPLWHMIAYAAGTGGSILLIGSAAGVAVMGLEKLDFFTYLRKASLPTLLGFLGGMGVYFLIS